MLVGATHDRYTMQINTDMHDVMHVDCPQIYGIVDKSCRRTLWETYDVQDTQITDRTLHNWVLHLTFLIMCIWKG